MPTISRYTRALQISLFFIWIFCRFAHQHTSRAMPWGPTSVAEVHGSSGDNVVLKSTDRSAMPHIAPPTFPDPSRLARFSQALGDSVGLALPVAAAANEQFKRARNDHGDEDFCAVYAASKKK